MLRYIRYCYKKVSFCILFLLTFEFLQDYAFLSGLAYRSDNETQRELDGWFNGSAIAHPNIVNEWRTNNDIKSPVTFKLITFPDHGNFSYVSIRGTANAWDLFADAQLWSAAALMQGLRFVLPAGSMWTPSTYCDLLLVKTCL